MRTWGREAAAAAEALRAARKRIEDGWTQHAAYRTEQGDAVRDHRDPGWAQCCLTGALRAAAWESRGAVTESDLAAMVLEEIPSDEDPRYSEVDSSPIYYLEDWNDAPGRDRDDVLLLLDRAIDAAEQRAASHPLQDDVAR